MEYSKSRPEMLDRNVLEGSKDVIFLVDCAFQITYCNPAWDAFATANGGEQIVARHVVGTDLFSAISGPLRDFYRDVCCCCLRQHLTFDFDYECSGASLYRLLHMKILPLKDSGELAFINSFRVERLHGAERPVFPPTGAYIGSHGMITICCHCRRACRQDASELWDWVPDFLQAGKWQVTHGMCPVCTSYFYSRYLFEKPAR
jgi:hypothetical protein